MSIGKIKRVEKNIQIWQGDEYHLPQPILLVDVDGLPVDLSTGHTALMQIRNAPGGDVIHEVADAQITLGVNAISDITIATAATAALDFAGSAVFDVVVTETATSKEQTVVFGSVSLRKRVTVPVT